MVKILNMLRVVLLYFNVEAANLSCFLVINIYLMNKTSISWLYVNLLQFMINDYLIDLFELLLGYIQCEFPMQGFVC